MLTISTFIIEVFSKLNLSSRSRYHDDETRKKGRHEVSVCEKESKEMFQPFSESSGCFSFTGWVWLLSAPIFYLHTMIGCLFVYCLGIYCILFTFALTQNTERNRSKSWLIRDWKIKKVDLRNIDWTTSHGWGGEKNFLSPPCSTLRFVVWMFNVTEKNPTHLTRMPTTSPWACDE